MAILDCRPPYDFVPDFRPDGQCTAPGFVEKRARLFAGGTFFRSKNAGSSQNLIAVQFTKPGSTVVLNVYNNGVLVESFDSGTFSEIPPPEPSECDGDVAKALRTLVNSGSDFIEMPPIDHGGTSFGPEEFIASNSPSSTPPGDDCDTLFGPTNLSGGSGPPTTEAGLAGIRTGPQRALVIVQLTEVINNNSSDLGLLVNPPSGKVRQFDGVDWIPYTPNSDCVLLP